MQIPKVKTWIQQAKLGSPIAFSNLLDSYWDSILFYIRSKINSKEDAEDITIMSFSKAFQHIEQFDENFDFAPWLFKITNNLIIDYYRKKKLEIISLESAEEFTLLTKENSSASVEDEYILQQINKEIETAIKQIDIKYRKVLILRFLKEKSYKEIAEELKLNISNVKVLIMRGKRVLMNSLPDGL